MPREGTWYWGSGGSRSACPCRWSAQRTQVSGLSGVESAQGRAVRSARVTTAARPKGRARPLAHTHPNGSRQTAAAAREDLATSPRRRFVETHPRCLLAYSRSSSHSNLETGAFISNEVIDRRVLRDGAPERGLDARWRRRCQSLVCGLRSWYASRQRRRSSSSSFPTG